jgi:hypothetical protein
MVKFTYDPYAYELQAAREVGSLDSVTDAVHWAQVPEKMLLDSGYIVDMGSHRTERLRNGGFRDYGLDGLARCADGSYIGIQAKAYGRRSTITASCLGTFQLAITFMREKNALSRGVLIHTPEARIENRLKIAIDRGMGGITHSSLPFADPVDAVDTDLGADDIDCELRLQKKNRVAKTILILLIHRS